MISPRAAGIAFAILGIAFAGAMLGLNALFGATTEPNELVSIVTATIAIVSAVAAVLLLIVLGGGPRPTSSGLVLVVTGIQVAAAVVGAVVLVLAQVQGATTVFIGALTVVGSTILVGLTASWTRKAMARNRGAQSGQVPPGPR
ncbi:hypothetical protein EXU48_19135 [Occultella glacieicola]|uniref:Uncharacterized protein n=1 Tax=Occultella glacieicola TaxID=2518684 RepID=A0ABY2DZB8_9MICO|nr:hypothetical protein [Occultella glacieicola]TDE90037.1 hypothetical protein EXU48_19135 [Occultella glacieicola]